MERKRQSQFNLTTLDSPELDTVVDKRVLDAGLRGTSDVFEGDISTASIAGIPNVIAESPTSIPATQRSSTNKRREVCSMSERIMSQQSDRVDVESLGDSHQAPVNVRSLPPISMVGAGDFRFNVSVPRAEEQQYAFCS